MPNTAICLAIVNLAVCIFHENGGQVPLREQALTYSRVRYAFADGDNQRGRNQMQVLTAIINKLQSPALLKNPTDVLDVISQSMQTSFTTQQITKVISWQLENGYSWDIQRQSVTGTPDIAETYSMPGTDLSITIPDEKSVAEAGNRIREMME